MVTWAADKILAPLSTFFEAVVSAQPLTALHVCSDNGSNRILRKTLKTRSRKPIISFHAIDREWNLNDPITHTDLVSAHKD